MRALTSYGIALILLVVIGLWMSTGLFVQGGNGPELGERRVIEVVEPEGGILTSFVESTGLAVEHHEPEGAENPALSIAERSAILAQEAGEARSVRVEKFTMEPLAMVVTLRGHTKASITLNAVAETSGLIETVEVEEGQFVTKGDLLCTLDPGTRAAGVAQAKAAIAQAEANLAQAQTDFNTNKSLRERGLASVNSAETFETGLKAAQAGLETAVANLQAAENELSKTEIRAEITGIVQQPLAEAGSLANMGTSCATIIQLDPMMFVGEVPQSRIDMARLGLTAEIRTINGQSTDGEVTFISVSANPATRTFPVEIEFANPDGAIRDGLTAEADVNMGNVPAHLIPQSVLTLDEDGTLGVRTVKDSVVEFHPITILRDTREGVWVAGLPPVADIIVVGQEYVVAGQVVDPGYTE